MRQYLRSLCALLTAIILINAGHALSSSHTTSRAIEISDLETNATPQPLGIDDPAPRFTWKLVSDRIHVEQAQFRLLVASKPEFLKPGRADVWDSKVIRSSKWKRTASGLELEVVVPTNVRASVYVPATKQAAVTVDGVREKGVVKFIRLERDRVVYEVGSGNYRFRVAK